jgi:hypothetical protein
MTDVRTLGAQKKTPANLALEQSKETGADIAAFEETINSLNRAEGSYERKNGGWKI